MQLIVLGGGDSIVLVCLATGAGYVVSVTLQPRLDQLDHVLFFHVNLLVGICKRRGRVTMGGTGMGGGRGKAHTMPQIRNLGVVLGDDVNEEDKYVFVLHDAARHILAEVVVLPCICFVCGGGFDSNYALETAGVRV